MSTRLGLLAVLGSLAWLSMGGCPQSFVRIPFPFELQEDVGTFELVAGQSTENRGIGSVEGSTVTIRSGTMQIKAENVRFTPTPAKGQVNQQATGTVTVTAMVAGDADVETVCETPVDSYGPYTITFDGDFNVTSILPETINLAQSTVDILNAGSFSFCLIADSQVFSGTLTVDELSFTLGL